MKFVKEKMFKRVTEAGKADLLDEKTIEIIDNLDGCEATSSCWERVVNDAPVLWVVGKNGKGEYVNEADCE